LIGAAPVRLAARLGCDEWKSNGMMRYRNLT
jgi:hypothetical protein